MDFELKDFEMYNAVSRESEKYQTKEFSLFFLYVLILQVQLNKTEQWINKISVPISKNIKCLYQIRRTLMTSRLLCFWCVFLLLAAEKKTPKTGELWRR